MSLASSLATLPALPFLPIPSAFAWPFILASSALHVAYNCALVRAYAYGELGQVYAVARGLSPLLVTAGAAFAAGEWPTPLSLAGTVLVSGGILSLAVAWAKTSSPAGLLAALLTGVLIASYTVTDGLGARLSGNAISYAAWLFFLDGIPMVALYRFAYPDGERIIAFDSAAVKALGGGIASLAAYAAVILAATLAPLGEVSALRETSVVFAAFFGRFFLNETLSLARLISFAAVAAGAVCLAWRS